MCHLNPSVPAFVLQLYVQEVDLLSLNYPYSKGWTVCSFHSVYRMWSRNLRQRTGTGSIIYNRLIKANRIMFTGSCREYLCVVEKSNFQLVKKRDARFVQPRLKISLLHIGLALGYGHTTEQNMHAKFCPTSCPAPHRTRQLLRLCM